LEDFSQDDLLDSVEQIFHKVCVRGSGLVRVDFTLQRIFVLTQESASDVGSRYFWSQQPCDLQYLSEDDILNCLKNILH